MHRVSHSFFLQNCLQSSLKQIFQRQAQYTVKCSTFWQKTQTHNFIYKNALLLFVLCGSNFPRHPSVLPQNTFSHPYLFLSFQSESFHYFSLSFYCIFVPWTEWAFIFFLLSFHKNHFFSSFLSAGAAAPCPDCILTAFLTTPTVLPFLNELLVICPLTGIPYICLTPFQIFKSTILCMSNFFTTIKSFPIG